MENRYENQKIGEKIKTGFKNAVIAYAVLGSLYMLPYTLTGETTGHRSADLHIKRNIVINPSFTRLSRLEKAICKPIFDKLNIKTDLLDK